MVIKIAERSVAIRFFQYPNFLVYISVLAEGHRQSQGRLTIFEFLPHPDLTKFTLIDEPFSHNISSDCLKDPVG